MVWSVVFSDTWAGTDGDPWDVSKWAVAASSTSLADISTNRGRMVAQGAAFTNVHAEAIMDPIGSTRITGTLQLASIDEKYPQIAINHDGTWGANLNPQNAYVIEPQPSLSQIVVFYEVNQDRTVLATIPFTFTATTYQMIVERDVETTDLLFKLWEDGTAEPGAWTGSISDGTFVTGIVSLAQWNGGSGAAETVYYDNLNVSEYQQTQWYTDFDDYTVDTALETHDWTQNWSTIPDATVRQSGAESYIEIVNLDATARRSAWSWDAVGIRDTTDYPIRVRSEFEYPTLGQHGFVTGHIAGAAGSEEVYDARGNGSGDVNLVKYKTGTGTLLDEVLAFLTANTRYQSLLEIHSAGVRLKVWETGNAEPGTWTLASTDDRVASGGIGFLGFEATGQLHVYWIGVGVAGSDAPIAPTSVGAERGTTWATRAALPADRVGLWSVSADIAGVRTALWDVEVPVTAIGSERQAIATVLALTAETRIAIWDAESHIPPIYNSRAEVKASKAVRATLQRGGVTRAVAADPRRVQATAWR